MRGKDLISYLANLITIATADELISKEEESAIERVYKEINAKETNLKEAKMITKKGDYQVTPVGRYSERIRNLEDMIFVALSDSDLSDSEKNVILTFAKAIGAKQEQINTILSESITRFRNYNATIVCPGCDHEIPSDWKFCAECGTSIQAATEASSTASTPNKDETSEDLSEEKGIRFEKYILNRFNLKFCKVKEWRGDKFTDGIYAESTKYPDIEIEFSLKGTKKLFAVECKWRRTYFNNGIKWARKEQIFIYKGYSEKNNIPVFVVIGVGNYPDNPEDVFVVPLDDLTEAFLTLDFLAKYRRLDKDKYFFFDLEKSVLR
jgi:uncharacterized tellurite resistance protein B-like protein